MRAMLVLGGGEILNGEKKEVCLNARILASIFSCIHTCYTCSGHLCTLYLKGGERQGCAERVSIVPRKKSRLSLYLR